MRPGPGPPGAGPRAPGPGPPGAGPEPPRPPDPVAPPPYGRAFWLALPLGGLLMAWGVAGLLRHAESTVPASWLRWLLGVLLAHDLLLAPAVLGAGLLLRRAPAAWRPPLRAALIVSGTLALMSVPLLLGYGRAAQPGNRSLQPGNYPLNLAAVLAVVWALALAWGLLRRRAARGSGGLESEAPATAPGRQATPSVSPPVDQGRPD